MIFSEIYGAYYNTVLKILKVAAEHPLTTNEMRGIIEEYAFHESILAIEPALKEGKWQLIKPDGCALLRHAPNMPLTTLQKRWIKAIAQDPRIRLFNEELPNADDVEPLFTPEDIYIFDKYADGDDFSDEDYIQNFRLILHAIEHHYALSISVLNRKGNQTYLNAFPEYLEYSEKDDKFRLFTSDCRYGKTINLGRIISCKPYSGKSFTPHKNPNPIKMRSLILELVDERNALKRVMLHFAHFKKEAERIDDKHYRMTIRYNRDDETEMVIRVLSFGPFIKVAGPEYFVKLIKERLKMQKSCEL